MGVAGSELYAADIPLSEMIIDPNISFLNSTFSNRNALIFGSRLSGVGFFGGNIKTIPNISSVPVPAAIWLFGSGLLGFVGVKRVSLKR